MQPDAALDAAQASREVAMFTALLLIRTGGDPTAAMELADTLDDIAAPEGLELDCVALAQQGIHDAMCWIREGHR